MLCSTSKFSELIFPEIHGDQFGEFVSGFWDFKG